MKNYNHYVNWHTAHNYISLKTNTVRIMRKCAVFLWKLNYKLQHTILESSSIISSRWDSRCWPTALTAGSTHHKTCTVWFVCHRNNASHHHNTLRYSINNAMEHITVTIHTRIEKMFESFKNKFHKCWCLFILVQVSDTKRNELPQNCNHKDTALH